MLPPQYVFCVFFFTVLGYYCNLLLHLDTLWRLFQTIPMMYVDALVSTGLEAFMVLTFVCYKTPEKDLSPFGSQFFIFYFFLNELSAFNITLKSMLKICSNFTTQSFSEVYFKHHWINRWDEQNPASLFE